MKNLRRALLLCLLLTATAGCDRVTKHLAMAAPKPCRRPPICGILAGVAILTVEGVRSTYTPTVSNPRA